MDEIRSNTGQATLTQQAASVSVALDPSKTERGR